VRTAALALPTGAIRPDSRPSAVGPEPLCRALRLK